MTDFSYRRRKSSVVRVGDTPLGGENPIRVQSMTNTSTMDTEASVAQAARMAKAGAEYVRLTAQGVREAENLGIIRTELRNAGINVPLVADIHFNPRAAFAAAETVEKVRINPGNFVDPGRTFKQIEYSDDEYWRELEKIEQSLIPFLEVCRKNNVAVRIGVNHGSLSDRIMSRYGNTPGGMVESAMEFLRVCRKIGFTDVVVSMKASNTVVMVESVRRLVAAMDAEDMHFPLHLGVTEAGGGEDGRIKSAVGIGALLAEGIGDTIRVSLSEAPENEIPVARELIDYITERGCGKRVEGELVEGYDSMAPSYKPASSFPEMNLSVSTAVYASAEDMDGGEYDPDRTPDAIISNDFVQLNANDMPEVLPEQVKTKPIVLSVAEYCTDPVGCLKAALHKLGNRGVVVELTYNGLPKESVALRAAADFGAILLSGFAQGIKLEADMLSPRQKAEIAFGILQAARRRFTKTEFISCPGCGRTLFDLESTVKKIKSSTSHLKGLKIGVMGCIVNGPGEMADADYGYVGAAARKVSLYKGKECVEKNIPSENALERLVELLKEEGVWTEPVES